MNLKSVVIAWSLLLGTLPSSWQDLKLENRTKTQNIGKEKIYYPSEIKEVFLQGVDNHKRVPKSKNIAVDGYDQCQEYEFTVWQRKVRLYDCLTKAGRYHIVWDDRSDRKSWVSQEEQDALLQQLKK